MRNSITYSLFQLLHYFLQSWLGEPYMQLKMVETEKAILVREPTRKQSYGKSSCRREDNIKINLKKINYGDVD